MSKSSIIDLNGNPMQPAANARPYGAADTFSQELSTWFPYLGSADSEYIPDRDMIVSRTRDLVRNSGWASGALSRHLDNVIGSGFRLSSKPDYKALGLDDQWAKEFAEEVEGRWRIFSEDPDNWIDATRQDNFNGLLGLAYRHKLTDGEATAAILWLNNKPFGRYATTIKLIDPDRLSNPNNQFDTDLLKGGVELDRNGAPIAYHIRNGHPSDWHLGSKSYSWTRIPRETRWGRKRFIHAYDKERANQTRGIGLLTPVIERLKMIDKYDRVELQAALVNAIFAAFIESPFDHDMLDDAISADQLSTYQKQRADFHDKRQVRLDGVRIPTLFPGESFNFQAASRPAAQFGEFEKACLRNIAAGTGLSYEQISQDWSETNYSSARGALLEVWKTLSRNRSSFADKFATPVFILFLEEAINRGDIKLPQNGPDFYTAKAAYCKIKWIGQGRGWVDPVKEAQAAQIRMDSCLSTLEDECADQGKDWQEVLQQRKREIEEMDKLGVPRPEWADKMALPSPNQPDGDNQNA